MLAEHQQGRAFVKQMLEHLPQARAGETSDIKALIEAGRGYIDLLRQHINKEDNVLFMMADRVVDPAGCARLCDKYAAVCSGRFDGQTKQQLHELADRVLDESGV